MSNNGSDQRAWKATRFHVLGDSPEKEEAEDSEDQGGNKKNPDSANNSEVEIQECDTDSHIDSVERIRNEIRNAWGVAPNLAALLDTVSQAAKDFTPSEMGMIGAAVGIRQKNAKNEYLRAFTNLLVKGRHYNFTPNIMDAMAAVATVVINDPDVVVEISDVRATLKKLDKP